MCEQSQLAILLRRLSAALRGTEQSRSLTLARLRERARMSGVGGARASTTSSVKRSATQWNTSKLSTDARFLTFLQRAIKRYLTRHGIQVRIPKNQPEHARLLDIERTRVLLMIYPDRIVVTGDAIRTNVPTSNFDRS